MHRMSDGSKVMEEADNAMSREHARHDTKLEVKRKNEE